MADKRKLLIKNIMLSGPDGTGKSTIAESVINSFNERGYTIHHIWLRFNHYFSKVVNLIGRISGKSFYEHHSWGKVGYHDYNGLIGYLYIFTVFVDHIIFTTFFVNTKVHNDKNYLIDRYIIDIMADLIVDSNKAKVVFYFFGPILNIELKRTNAYILKCDKNIVYSRRPDIIDDKSYDKKVIAYDMIASKFNIAQLNTGKLRIDEVVSVILNKTNINKCHIK